MTRLTATALLFAALSGCTGPTTSDAPQFVDFSGKVTVNGQPGNLVAMKFNPADPANKYDANALVTNGEYKVRLAPGKYIVSFLTTDRSGTAVPSKYSAANSKEELDATKAGTKDFDLK